MPRREPERDRRPRAGLFFTQGPVGRPPGGFRPLARWTYRGIIPRKAPEKGLFRAAPPRPVLRGRRLKRMFRKMAPRSQKKSWLKCLLSIHYRDAKRQGWTNSQRVKRKCPGRTGRLPLNMLIFLLYSKIHQVMRLKLAASCLVPDGAQQATQPMLSRRTPAACSICRPPLRLAVTTSDSQALRLPSPECQVALWDRPSGSLHRGDGWSQALLRPRAFRAGLEIPGLPGGVRAPFVLIRPLACVSAFSLSALFVDGLSLF